MSPRETARHVWTQLPFFAWLVVLWMLLWGQFTILAAVTGIGVAAVVTFAFRLPTAELSGRVNVWWLVVALAQFLWEVVSGALQVAWQAITPRPPTAAVVRVPLRIDDDLIMTHIAVALSLVPGSTVIESDRRNRVLFVHVLGVRSAEDIVGVRENALLWERRIVKAVGSRSAVRIVRAGGDVFVERRMRVGAERRPEGGDR